MLVSVLIEISLMITKQVLILNGDQNPGIFRKFGMPIEVVDR